MEITRNVEFGGKIYAKHVIREMRPGDGMLTVVVSHYVSATSGEPDYQADTAHFLEYNLGTAFSDVLENLAALPEYAEYVDPNVALIDQMSEMLDDEEAATVPSAFKEWQPGTDYAAGDRRRYGGSLYKCLIAHTSQADQTPDVTVSLWAAIIASEDPDQPLPWVQPDSTNPYMRGDRVTHNGSVWESDIDYNVFEPGVAGWTVVE